MIMRNPRQRPSLGRYKSRLEEIPSQLFVEIGKPKDGRSDASMEPSPDSKNASVLQTNKSIETKHFGASAIIYLLGTSSDTSFGENIIDIYSCSCRSKGNKILRK